MLDGGKGSSGGKGDSGGKGVNRFEPYDYGKGKGKGKGKDKGKDKGKGKSKGKSKSKPDYWGTFDRGRSQYNRRDGNKKAWLNHISVTREKMQELFLAEKTAEQWDERVALTHEQFQDERHAPLFETDKLWGQPCCTVCQSYGDHNASACPSGARKTQEQLDYLSAGF